MQAGNGSGNGDNGMRNRAVMFIYVCANAPNNAQKIIIITISITIIMIMITIRYDVRKCVCVWLFGRTTPYKYESFRSVSFHTEVKAVSSCLLSYPSSSSSPSSCALSLFFLAFMFVLLSTLHALCIASQMSHLSAH